MAPAHTGISETEDLEEKLYTCMSHVEAPRWAGVRDYLWELSMHTGVDLKILDMTRQCLGLRERVYFKFSSPDRERMDEFKAILLRAAEEYNRE